VRFKKPIAVPQGKARRQYCKGKSQVSKIIQGFLGLIKNTTFRGVFYYSPRRKPNQIPRRPPTAVNNADESEKALSPHNDGI